MDGGEVGVLNEVGVLTRPGGASPDRSTASRAAHSTSSGQAPSTSSGQCPSTSSGQGLWTDARPARQIDDLDQLLRGRSWVVLSGAGASTDSGIPDYRGPTSVRASPMQYAEFLGSREAQQRYWARSYLGWRRIGQARPNPGHRALAALEASGLRGLITQNVDGLHAVAGSRNVINLHGDIASVVCLDCAARSARAALQERLARLNPGLADAEPVRAELRPDGDAAVADWRGFVLAPCLTCGGRLKPDVVFFGESVPKPRVEQAYALLEPAAVLVVVGSSLTVMSGLRFVRYQAKRSRPVAIINRGATRGDDLATLKIDGGCSETLVRLLQRW